MAHRPEKFAAHARRPNCRFLPVWRPRPENALLRLAIRGENWRSLECEAGDLHRLLGLLVLGDIYIYLDRQELALVSSTTSETGDRGLPRARRPQRR